MPPETAAKVCSLRPPASEEQWADRRAVMDYVFHELSQPLTSLGFALELSLRRPADPLRDRGDLQRAFDIFQDLTRKAQSLRAEVENTAR